MQFVPGVSAICPTPTVIWVHGLTQAPFAELNPLHTVNVVALLRTANARIERIEIENCIIDS